MTGPTVKQLRLQLNLNLARFAELVGVAPSTVWRWEGTVGALHVDPGASRILAMLMNEVEQRTPEECAQFSRNIAEALVLGGGLKALWVVMRSAYA